MINIRKISMRDIEKLTSIKSQITKPDIDNRLNRQAKGEVDFLVLEENYEPKSFILLKWKGKKSHPEYPDMEDLYTKESERGKGYGTLLIKECELFAKEKGFNKIGLAVNPTENQKALLLYQKLGYKHDGKEKYLDGVYNGVEDWVIDLEKDL